MAVSGAGGWVPSRSVMQKGGRLVLSPITQNKPRETLYSCREEKAKGDLRALCMKLWVCGGEFFEMDFRYPNYKELKERWDGPAR